jgi:NAD(P)-dependent dehydrogenase (short-subunit alcohol dehydrogenase family)
MRRLDGRVAIVSGAGRGLGRAHAMYLASHGASVVVNDLGGDVHGVGSDQVPAADVVREIVSMGGEAVPSSHDVSDWDQAGELVNFAIETFGSLHVVVNNAGILRDRLLANMTEDEWDAVIRVHLKGHAAPTRHAMAYWRDRAKAGKPLAASVVHTTSIAAFAGNFGQANYTAAKSAVIGLSQVVAIEGSKYGVRSNAVSPSARTRITLTDKPAPESDQRPHGLDPLDPANVSPLIGWLAEEKCPATSQVFHVYGNRLLVIAMPSAAHDLRNVGRWTAEDLDRAVPQRLLKPPDLYDFVERL